MILALMPMMIKPISKNRVPKSTTMKPLKNFLTKSHRLSKTRERNWSIQTFVTSAIVSFLPLKTSCSRFT